jgi:hypothetical protein
MTNHPGSLLRSAPHSVRSRFDLGLRFLAAMLTIPDCSLGKPSLAPEVAS